jgi:hypothetical protein
MGIHSNNERTKIFYPKLVDRLRMEIFPVNDRPIPFLRLSGVFAYRRMSMPTSEGMFYSVSSSYILKCRGNPVSIHDEPAANLHKEYR